MPCLFGQAHIEYQGLIERDNQERSEIAGAFASVGVRFDTAPNILGPVERGIKLRDVADQNTLSKITDVGGMSFEDPTRIGQLVVLNWPFLLPRFHGRTSVDTKC